MILNVNRMYKPDCENPILLVNKYCLTLVQNGHQLFIKGQVSHVDLLHTSLSVLLLMTKDFKDIDFDGCFVQCPTHKEPLFVYAPCGHCDICRHKRQVDIINRCTVESATWDCPPFFITLTYDEEHLPCLSSKYPYLCRGDLRYKDVQDFFKRLRIKWTRKGISHNIRYLVAGEYGKLGRCHYHIILFNNPYQADELHPLLFNQLKDDIFTAWSKCQPQAFDFGQCYGSVAPYATKYVLKPSLSHGHHIKPFVKMSSGRNGGLGVPFLKDYIDYLRSNPSMNYIDFVDKHGKYQFIYLSKFLSNHVWPSPSMSVPSSLRNAYRQLKDVLMLMESLRIINLEAAISVSDFFRPSPCLLNDVKHQPLHFVCHLQKKRYNNLFSKTLDDLFYILSEKVNNDAYLKQYYMHKSFILPKNNDSLATKIVKIRQSWARLSDAQTL